MELFLTIVLFLLGLVLIVKGGDWFVDAASWMATASGIPQFIIGATIVSIATTMPEVIVSTMAAAEGSTEMAIGNAIGSALGGAFISVAPIWALPLLSSVCIVATFILEVGLLRQLPKKGRNASEQPHEHETM